jgi:hypothetical protein
MTLFTTPPAKWQEQADLARKIGQARKKWEIR